MRRTLHFLLVVPYIIVGVLTILICWPICYGFAIVDALWERSKRE